MYLAIERLFDQGKTYFFSPSSKTLRKNNKILCVFVPWWQIFLGFDGWQGLG